MCVRPPLNHVVVYIFKFIVWRGNYLAVEVRFYIFVQWGWFKPFSSHDFPGLYKRPRKRSLSLFLTYFSCRTDQLSFHAGIQQHTDLQHERAHSIFDHCFFRRPFFHYFSMRECIQYLTTVSLENHSFTFHSFLLNQLDLELLSES